MSVQPAARLPREGLQGLQELGGHKVARTKIGGGHAGAKMAEDVLQRSLRIAGQVQGFQNVRHQGRERCQQIQHWFVQGREALAIQRCNPLEGFDGVQNQYSNGSNNVVVCQPASVMTQIVCSPTL